MMARVPNKPLTSFTNHSLAVAKASFTICSCLVTATPKVACIQFFSSRLSTQTFSSAWAANRQTVYLRAQEIKHRNNKQYHYQHGNSNGQYFRYFITLQTVASGFSSMAKNAAKASGTKISASCIITYTNKTRPNSTAVLWM
jgi:hypothetical protein